MAKWIIGLVVLALLTWIVFDRVLLADNPGGGGVDVLAEVDAPDTTAHIYGGLYEEEDLDDWEDVGAGWFWRDMDFHNLDDPNADAYITARLLWRGPQPSDSMRFHVPLFDQNNSLIAVLEFKQPPFRPDEYRDIKVPVRRSAKLQPELIDHATINAVAPSEGKVIYGGRRSPEGESGSGGGDHEH